jgi:NAD(P)-dependent dehydrogenase (short-subunit alcohol dehydrogenase family)
MMELSNRVCIITGASKGLGRTIALALSEEGARVAINGRNEADLLKLADEIRQSGREVLIAKADVSKSEEVNSMVASVVDRFGRVDVLVNNAGGAMFTNHVFAEVTEDEWDRVVDTNLKGAFLCCKAVVPHMVAQKAGKIINMSSLAGRSNSRLAGVQYSSAKAGLQGLTRHLARELGPSGITVNAVAPGIIFSDRVRKLYESKPEEERSKILAQTPLGRMGEREEVAAAVVFLASCKADYINGATIDVNGGAYMS